MASIHAFQHYGFVVCLVFSLDSPLSLSLYVPWAIWHRPWFYYGGSFCFQYSPPLVTNIDAQPSALSTNLPFILFNSPILNMARAAQSRDPHKWKSPIFEPKVQTSRILFQIYPRSHSPWDHQHVRENAIGQNESKLIYVGPIQEENCTTTLEDNAHGTCAILGAILEEKWLVAMLKRRVLQFTYSREGSEKLCSSLPTLSQHRKSAVHKKERWGTKLWKGTPKNCWFNNYRDGLCYKSAHCWGKWPQARTLGCRGKPQRKNQNGFPNLALVGIS